MTSRPYPKLTVRQAKQTQGGNWMIIASDRNVYSSPVEIPEGRRINVSGTTARPA